MTIANESRALDGDRREAAARPVLARARRVEPRDGPRWLPLVRREALRDVGRRPFERILLLNPPGDARYLREYYCSKVSKAGYVYPPIDLLVLSGILHDSYELSVIDAVVERLGVDACLARVLAAAPDAIVVLTGSVSHEQDLAFLRRVREQCDAPVLASGDVLLEQGAERLAREDCLDAILLDFTSSEILGLLSGEPGPFGAITFKSSDGVVPAEGSHAHGTFEIPTPRHELFLNRRYRHPFARHEPVTTMLTDFGCPAKCTFCVMPGLGWSYRGVESVIAELNHAASLGIRELYFVDQTFGANKPRSREICRRMTEELPRLSWACYSRVDVVDDELLRLMKNAGCHTVVFGIEGANKAIRDTVNKGITAAQIDRAFSLCRAHGIRTAATFILGLPDEREEDIEATIRFALDLRCDFASFNLPVPRMGTGLRHEAIRLGLVAPELDRMDQSGTFAVMGTRYLTKDDLERLAAGAIRRFYFRPSYLLRRLAGIRTWTELKGNGALGLAVVRDALRRHLKRSESLT